MMAGLVIVLLSLNSCERDLSDDAVVAGNNTDPTVYIDGFTTGLDYFPYADAFQMAFSNDMDEVFAGSSSMRFDVPNPSNADGAFAGAIFRTTDTRDLSSYDALTFYAKASQGAVIGQIGFGQNFRGDRFAASISNLQLDTRWTKYVIPVPDPSKLDALEGLLNFSTAGSGAFTFWLDEVQYERLGTIAQPRPTIVNGEIVERETFIGSQFTLDGLAVTYNLANGGDVTVNTAPAYFNFESSNPNVVTVSETGVVNVIAASPIDPVTMLPEVVTVTATLGTDENGDPLQAAGEVRIVSLGNFDPAPTPTRDAENVISIFSDAYTDVPVDYYNGFFAPFQTTQGGTPPLTINNEQVINYTNLNFVAIGTFLNVSSVDASSMTHIHVDINVQETLQSGDYIDFQLNRNIANNETSAAVRLTNADLLTNDWASFDIPLTEFSALGGLDNIGLYFFISDNTISNILVDNVYFYREVVDPTPTVDDSMNSQVELPVGYESTSLTYDINFFNGAVSQIINNPDTSGINDSSRVLETVKNVGADFFAGTFINLDAPIDLTTSQILRLKVWSPKANIPVRLALELAGGGGQITADATVLDANEWTELEFDFSSVAVPGSNYQRVVTFFEFVPGLMGDGSLYYSDDLKVLP